MLQLIMKGLVLVIIVSGFFMLNKQPAQSDERELLASNPDDSTGIEYDYIDTAHLNLRLHPQGTYTATINKIAELRTDLKERIATTENTDSLLQIAGKLLEEKIVNTVLPFWYGTEWDFNGTTDTPRVGKIACGYLASTVLKHSGFNLNRYTMAQQSAWNEARTLQLSDRVQHISGDHEHFADKFKEIYKDGLYLVGLDFHVGFLLLRKGEIFFIHSSYISPAVTVIEKIALSDAFHASRGYYIAEISTNLNLIKKWIMQEQIQVRKD